MATGSCAFAAAHCKYKIFSIKRKAVRKNLNKSQKINA